MSDSAQFLGSGGVPVGGFLPLFGAADNPTISGSEYLRSGVLKAAGSYASLIAANPGLAYALTVNKLALNAFSIYAAMGYAGGRYYAVGGGAAPKTTAALTSTWVATTVDTDATCNDAFSFNGRFIHVTTSTTTCYTFNASSAATAITVAGTMACGAGNAGNTLCHMVSTTNSVNGAYTSADGTTFTARTTTSTSNKQAIASVWQSVSSTFATLCTDGSVQTTTDGFTYTDRGATANVAAAGGYPTGQCGANGYSAASATVTLFSAPVIYNGTSQYALFSSTNGTSFTATPWSAVLGFTPTAQLMLTVSGTTFYATVLGQDLTVDRGQVFSSTDGVTWTRLATPLPSPLLTGYSSYGLRVLNGEFVIQPSAPSYPIGTLASFTPTHVGVPRVWALGQAGADLAQPATYVRIK